MKPKINYKHCNINYNNDKPSLEYETKDKL